MCTEVEQEFKKLWTKAGLEGSEPAADISKHEATAVTGEEQDEEEADDGPAYPGYLEVQESNIPDQYNVYQGMLHTR